MDAGQLKLDCDFLEWLLRPESLRGYRVPMHSSVSTENAEAATHFIAYRDWFKRNQALRDHNTEGIAPMTVAGEANCDILLVCPLSKEQEMACLVFGVDHDQPTRTPKGTKEFDFECGPTRQDKTLRVSLSVINRQTNLASASRVPVILARNRPRVAILIGIGATLEPYKLGHVIAANYIYYTEGGVATKNGKLPRAFSDQSASYPAALK
jgi:hypothetical protein